MTKAIALRPSVGFIFLVSSYLLLLFVLSWGYSKPELDRVWLIQQSMLRRQFAGLCARDVQTLKTALNHYPGLPLAFIGRAQIGFIEPTHQGWISIPRSHVVTDGHTSGVLAIEVECQAPDNEFPVVVSFDRDGLRQYLRFPEGGRQRLEMQLGARAAPALIQMSIEPAGHVERGQVKIKI